MKKLSKFNLLLQKALNHKKKVYEIPSKPKSNLHSKKQ